MAKGAKEGQPQADSNASPIYGITIPAGYRDWRLISVNHLAGGNLKQVRAQLGNDIAIKAFREGKLPFPDGTIIAALHWNEVASDENNKVLASGFPGAGFESFVAGSAMNVQFMVKDQRSTSQLAGGDLPTSRTANLATRRCTKLVSPAISLQKIATTSSLTTHQRLELRPAPNSLARSIFGRRKDGCSCSSEGGKKLCSIAPADE